MFTLPGKLGVYTSAEASRERHGASHVKTNKQLVHTVWTHTPSLSQQIPFEETFFYNMHIFLRFYVSFQYWKCFYNIVEWDTA